jgi:hypothetical protein
MIDINKQYKTRSGSDIELVSDAGREPYPIIGYTDDSAVPMGWTRDGQYITTATSALDLVEVRPYEDWEIDDRIEVSADGIYWHKRHFAGIANDGIPMTWNAGLSSWTEEYNGGKVPWKYARKPEGV